jgi:hypothetical protein
VDAQKKQDVSQQCQAAAVRRRWFLKGGVFHFMRGLVIPAGEVCWDRETKTWVAALQGYRPDKCREATPYIGKGFETVGVAQEWVEEKWGEVNKLASRN